VVAHKGTAAVLDVDEASASEQGHGLADGVATDPELVDQLGFGRQGLARTVAAVLDLSPQVVCELAVLCRSTGAGSDAHAGSSRRPDESLSLAS
jgi:hypothetical protein